MENVRLMKKIPSEINALVWLVSITTSIFIAYDVGWDLIFLIRFQPDFEEVSPPSETWPYLFKGIALLSAYALSYVIVIKSKDYGRSIFQALRILYWIVGAWIISVSMQMIVRPFVYERPMGPYPFFVICITVFFLLITTTKLLEKKK